MSDRYGPPRRVVQAYRRLGERAGADNPYPTIVSATRAIEGMTSGALQEPQLELEEPRPLPLHLNPPNTFDTRTLTDNVMRSNKPPIPRKGADETSYPVNWWGRGDKVRPSRTEIIPDPEDPNREIIRSYMRGQRYGNPFAIAHTHPHEADPYPGPEDWKVPVQTGRPSYVATDNNIFRINPPDASGWLSVDLIDGEWGRPDAEVEAAIARMNRRETVGAASKVRRK